MYKIKSIIIGIIFAIIVSVSGWHYIKRVNWNVLNEQNNYENIVKINKDPLIIVACPFNKNIAQAVFNVAQIASHMKSIKGKIAWLIPISVSRSFESAIALKNQHALDVEIFLAPDNLWKSLFGYKGDDLDSQSELLPLYICFMNGKEVYRINGLVDWFTDNGINILNKAFNTKMLLIGNN